MMACDATVILQSQSSSREVLLADFYTGYRKTVRRPDELITAIRIPRRSHSHQSFHKVGPRKAQAITKVGVAIAHSSAGWRIAANSVAPTVKRCAELERAMTEGTRIDTPGDLLPYIDQDVSPIDDIRSTREYRRMVLSRVLFHALRGVAPGIGTT
jgi:xanthine dehydrogenase small subunit